MFDATYEIDHWNSGIILLCLLDNNMNIQIAAFGFVPVENTENNNWIFK